MMLEFELLLEAFSSLSLVSYIKTLKLLAILSASSLVHVLTILNFAPPHTKIPLGVHAITSCKQGGLLKSPSGVTAICDCDILVKWYGPNNYIVLSILSGSFGP